MTKQQMHEQNLQRAMRWLRDQAESGLGKDEWCKQNGINRFQFFKWQRILKEMPMYSTDIEDPKALDTNPVFVEIPMATAPAVPVNKSSELFSLVSIKYGGFSINVNSGVDEILLSTVLKAVCNAN